MEQEFFNKVLNHLPAHWDKKTYNSKLYELVPVQEYGDSREEYSEISSLFQSKGISAYSVSKIERIQNPFSYGCFLLRKEQLECGNRTVQMNRTLVIIDKSKIPDAITYNLDSRRTSYNTLSSYSSITTDQVIIVKKILSAYSEERDSNYYPEYIIYVTKI